MTGIKDIAEQELIGSTIEVIEASHKGYVGMKGRVIDETKNTFLIELENKKTIRMPKKNAKFKFTFINKNAIAIEGIKLIHRPENRLKERWLNNGC